MKSDRVASLFKKIARESLIKNVVGPNTAKISLSGNQEPLTNEIEIKLLKIFERDIIISDISVLYDSDGYEDSSYGFTIVKVTYFCKNTFSEYLNMLLDRIKIIEKPKKILNAFNKAIIIADDFNNRFGEENFNKTKELNEIQKTFELLNTEFN